MSSSSQGPVGRRRMIGAERMGFLALALVDLGVLWAGLPLPAFAMDRLAAEPQAYSVVTGGLELLRGSNPGLGVVVLLFSGVFPCAKLLGVMVLVWKPPSEAAGPVRRLEWLGKWSMLDVFVVATLIGAAQLGILSQVAARPGIYCFLAAVLGSIVLTVAAGSRLGLAQRPTLPSTGAMVRWSLVALSTSTLVLFLASLAMPLLEVEKWLFWSSDLSLLGAPRRLAGEGERGLAFIVGAFVIALPGLRLLCLVAARIVGGRSVPVAAAYHLDKWSMMDVYALALMVFVLKIGSFADIDLRLGFHLLTGAVALALVDGLVFRRALTFEPSGLGP